MKCCSDNKMRVYVLLIGATISLGAIFNACHSSDKEGTTLNGYTFSPESAALTNRYFPGTAGEVISFIGHGAFEGSVYTWTFTGGDTIQGVATLHEKGISVDPSGETSVEFDSLLAQDVQGNVHVLKNISGDTGTLSGVAAGLSATILMPGNPKAGDSFAPAANYIGTVLSVDETVDSYAGVLHTRFIVDQADNKKSQYDDYWAPGVGQVKSVWSLADGTTGYWSRIYPDFHTMQADLEACMQPGPPGESARIAFSKKYNVPLDKLEPLGASNWINLYQLACMGEQITIVGGMVWNAFAHTDGWIFRGFFDKGDSCGTEYDYCVAYKEKCGAGWSQGCLESKIGSRCFRH
jgi:hypothetical protein